MSGKAVRRDDPFIHLMDLRKLHAHFYPLRQTIAQTVGAMPDHTRYVRKLAG